MSHISDTQLHYKIIKPWYTIDKTKACSYWWFKLPTSLLGWAVLGVLAAFFCLVGLFIGYVPAYFGSAQQKEHLAHGDLFLEYKELPGGYRVRFAPWELILMALFVWGCFALVIDQRLFGGISYVSGGFVSLLPDLISALLILVLATAIFAFVVLSAYKIWGLRIWRRGCSLLVAKWDALCPTLVVEHKGKKKEDS